MGPQAQALLAAVPDDIEVSQVGAAPDTIKSPHAGKAGAIEPQRGKRAKRGPARPSPPGKHPCKLQRCVKSDAWPSGQYYKTGKGDSLTRSPRTPSRRLSPEFPGR